MKAIQFSDLMSIREAVEANGEQPTREAIRRMRRRIQLLDANAGGKILRTLDGRRRAGSKLWISKAALMFELRTDHLRHDADLSAIHCQIDGLTRKLSRVDCHGRRTARELHEFRNRQDSINRAQVAAIEAVRALAHTVGKSQTEPNCALPRALQGR